MFKSDYWQSNSEEEPFSESLIDIQDLQLEDAKIEKA
jgi:hypothetical protein